MNEVDLHILQLALLLKCGGALTTQTDRTVFYKVIE